MADEGRLDIRKAIADNAQVTDLSNLASSGVKRVKVLDENALQELIARAVDEVVSSQTSEERSRILADSRKQLQKLMNERDEFMSKVEQAGAGRSELIQQIEKLQSELKLRRKVDDQVPVLQARVEELEKENAWLRAEHDKMVEELDRLQTENKRLKEELEGLKALAEGAEEAQRQVDELKEAGETAASAMRRQLQEARAELAELKEKISREEARAAGDREQASEHAAHELESVRGELHKEAARRAEVEKRLADVQRKYDREREDADAAAHRELESVRDELHKEAARRAEVERRVHELEAKREEPPPPPPPPEPEPEPEPAPPHRPAFEGYPEGLRPGKGLDIGTVNLVSAAQNEIGETEIRLQRNVFIDVEITPYTKAMLTKLGVAYVIQGKRMYVLGEPAFQLANVLNRATRRPMADGLISPKEQDALPVMKLLIHSIIGDPRAPGEVCFYSVPGEPVDSDLSVAYHRDLFDAVLKSLGYKPSHILEGHAVTFAELADEDFTGIGVSCGGGMFNVCVAYKSMPALTFSTARSGDWVDRNVAQALGIKPEKAAMLKEKGVDLTKPMNREEDAIAIYYRNLIQYNLTNIAERFRAAENMPTFSEPVSLVFSGGTSMAGNFIELVKTVFKGLDFPIPIKDVRLAKDPLNATAKGALVAAQLEMANKPA
jgi:regulator of replication initiation timing